MYTNFFSLSELPFSIAPNPRYLFMSDRHREALTHLSYGLGGSALGDNGGFVLLTGEVGTGKTTVSRCLMADLPENTQLAFILNPTLSSQELLATICDQLKIRYRKTGATIKSLTDKIAEKLLKNHAQNINTLLIVDEAQHLEAEVLEQLRLLTNLETDTKKLLQVILIGQPELQQLLKRRDLRQLAQRITARYHLLPLNLQELSAYIKHRLSVADCHRALFNKGALVTIHKLSQGIPRLINLLCHSALMEAYNSNNAVVDKKIVLKAASHALGDDFEQVIWWKNSSIQIASAASILLAVLVIGIWLGGSQKSQEHSELVTTAKPSKIQQSQLEGIEEQASPAVNTVPENAAVTQPEPELVASLITTATNTSATHTTAPKITESTIPTQTQTTAPFTSTMPVEQVNATQSQPAPTTQIPKQIPTQLSDNNEPVQSQEKTYQVEAVDGVSEDLLARFQAAIEDTNNVASTQAQPTLAPKSNSEIRSITQMPAWIQDSLPNLTFEQHIYASDGQGWVNVNGRDRYEGDSITDGLIIDKILPQQVILTFKGETFSLPALTSW
ncbi:hypothetical protein NBRC116592_18220 [Colwellia sp. KU-HH00111]|uniref:AAA family ATPase n=1 Tax=Colwellia sp. KU-HH00111 TaxID=3127652 RepID=UPI0031049433